ncbi:tetratricopeptide repeat-containing sulfotransferase family protein [Thalassotalea atypica]|uniref:tetratricopeptide repeat-containing sulfotransferase family protein n=1 Tax=Thalassotalea atypica TaxID=2054316 RepID=UPI002573ED9D|nr:tetratricopeptide repeat-containing sulfotransferase family protein [Thalassotalea atypica]
MNFDQALQAAEQAQRSGNIDRARELYETIISHSSHTDALYGLATIYLQTKQFALAIPLFKQALKQEPNAADIGYNYILCLKESGNIQAALLVVDEMKKHALLNREIAMAYAFVSYQMNSFDRCITLLEKLNDNSTKTTHLLATCFMQTEQWLKAMELWQSLAKEQPQNCLLYKNLSIAASKGMKYETAIEAFEQVVRLEPTSGNFVKFADLYLIAHDSIQARAKISSAIAMGDKSLGRYETECKICRFENDRNGALLAAKAAIALKPSSDFAWQAIQEFGDKQDNETCVNRLATLTQDTSSSSFELQQNLFTYAKALEKTANYALAFDQFTKAKSLQYQRFCDNGNQYDKQEVEQQYQHLSSIPYQAMSKSRKVEHIFIVGMPRSGTTLINRLLSQPKHNKSCNESNGIATCFENSLLKTNRNPDQLADFLSEHRATHHHAYRDYVGIESQVLVDKMPHNFRYVGAILATIPNARIIQMRRDPQDLALSIYSHQFHEYHNYACQLEHIAHAIVQANKLMDSWKAQFPNQVIDLNYQDFVQKPLEQGKALFEFCEQTWDDSYLDFYKQSVPSFTFSEIQVRKPINTSKIGYSEHYQEQFAEFRRYYEHYYLAGR